jgi:hypothetical protein
VLAGLALKLTAKHITGAWVTGVVTSIALWRSYEKITQTSFAWGLGLIGKN